MALPQDPVLLVSVLNMKLRDYYPSLAALCDDLEEDMPALQARLRAAGYAYSEAGNCVLPL